MGTRRGKGIVAFLGVLTCMWLSGCIANTFYRPNGFKGNGVDPKQQDRFVPDELRSDFAIYTQDPTHWQMRERKVEETRHGGTQYFLSFIELDEFGELWYKSATPVSGSGPMQEAIPSPNFDKTDLVDQRDQFKHAINLIRYAKQVSLEKGGEGRIRLVVLVHGWKNNASDDYNNVWGFRKMLAEFAADTGRRASQMPLAQPGDCSTQGHAIQDLRAIPVVGIYIGWRGGVTNVPVVKEFTFKDRRSTAAEIGGAQLLEVLKSLRTEAKRPANAAEQVSADNGDGSPILLLGHSFGALLLERAISVSTAEYILGKVAENGDNTTIPEDGGGDGKTLTEAPAVGRRQLDFSPPFDRVIFVNSAASATEAHQLISMLQEKHISFEIPDGSGGLAPCPSGPVGPSPAKKDAFLFLAITSTGDLATQITMPIGETLWGKKTRDYREAELYKGFPRLMHQSTWQNHSVANLADLRTHLLCSDEDPLAGCRCSGKTAVKLFDLPRKPDTSGKRNDIHYCFVSNDKNTWNHTPYWATVMPPSVVPDHGDIFTDRFVRLLLQISENSIGLEVPPAKLVR